MSCYEYKKKSPKIGNECFLAASADVIGDVEIFDNVSIWFNCVVRGDVAPIKIGENSNIQDLSMLHVTGNIPLNIGKNVTIGHRVVLHSCTVEDSCLIGMGAIILDGAVIGEHSLVAAGSVVPPGKKYPAGSFIIGSPAILKRQLSEQELEEYGQHYRSYVQTKNEYLDEVRSL